jgi:hypothetical protein
MPYARSWYALRTGKSWLLGPSKFVGYQIGPEEYLKAATLLDGRVTESVLRRWSTLVEQGHNDYNDLHTALNELCARQGKKPNNLARISIIKSETEPVVSASDDNLVRLLAAVFRSLTPAQKSAFRKQVA